MSILQIKNLDVHLGDNLGQHSIIKGLDLNIQKGETFCLVGQSGSGKTVTMKSIMGLIDFKPGIIGGEIWLHPEGEERVNLLQGLSDNIGQYQNMKGEVCYQVLKKWKIKRAKIMTPFLGRVLGMIFQNPKSCLNPYWNVKKHLMESLKISGMAKKERDKNCLKLLERMHIHHPQGVLYTYPHQLSGGMAQRVMIAQAMALKPALLIADEPTTGLDVTIQAQIVQLFLELKQRYNTTVILITHDFGLANRLADRIGVMYQGQLLEVGDRLTILTDKTRKHPYTKFLLNSVRQMAGPVKDKDICQAETIPMFQGRGCAYYPNCDQTDSPAFQTRCDYEQPNMISLDEGNHLIRCFNYERARGKQSL